jgi:hypothetical protein
MEVHGGGRGVNVGGISNLVVRSNRVDACVLGGNVIQNFVGNVMQSECGYWDRIVDRINIWIQRCD